MLKRLGLLFCVYFFLITAEAYPQGYYLLGQLGSANTHQEASNADAISINSKIAFTGRIAGGYQPNPHIAFEIGYIRLDDIHFSGVGGFPGQTISLKNKALDFSVIPSLPLSNSLSMEMKLGLAYLKSNGSRVVHDHIYLGYSDSWDPVFGLGFSYTSEQYPCLPIVFSWTRIQNIGRGNTPPHIDFYSIGIKYYFG